MYTLQWEDDIIGLEGWMEDMDDSEMDTVPPPPPPANFSTPQTSRQPKPVPSSSGLLPMKIASSAVQQSAVNSRSSLSVTPQSMNSSSLSGSVIYFLMKVYFGFIIISSSRFRGRASIMFALFYIYMYKL